MNPQFTRFQGSINFRPPLENQDELPFLVEIRKRGSSVIQLGVAITGRWVLTAASPLSEVLAEDVQVSHWQDSGQNSVRAVKMIVHADYASRGQPNLALIKTNLTLADSIRPICLPENGKRDLDGDLTYGVSRPFQELAMANNGPQTILFPANMSVETNESLIVDMSMCKHLKLGDPLVTLLKGHQVLVGMFNRQITCSGDNQMSTRYVRISSVSDWIYETMFDKKVVVAKKAMHLQSNAWIHKVGHGAIVLALLSLLYIFHSSDSQ